MAGLNLKILRILEIGLEVSDYWGTTLRFWGMISLWPYYPEHTQSCQIMGDEEMVSLPDLLFRKRKPIYTLRILTVFCKPHTATERAQMFSL